jgi:hypothetical protein
MTESEAQIEERINREVLERVANQRREMEKRMEEKMEEKQKEIKDQLRGEMSEQIQQQLAMLMAQRTEPIIADSPRAVQSSCQSVQASPLFDPAQVVQINTYSSIRFKCYLITRNTGYILTAVRTKLQTPHASRRESGSSGHRDNQSSGPWRWSDSRYACTE